jgi:hypothetical protein
VRIAIEVQVPPTSVADEYPAAGIVMRVHQLHDVVAGVTDHYGVDGAGVLREIADLDSFEMQPATRDSEPVGMTAGFGKVEDRFLTRGGPVLDPVGVRGSALREREATAGIVGSSADVDRVSRTRGAGPLAQGGKRAGLGAKSPRANTRPDSSESRSTLADSFLADFIRGSFGALRESNGLGSCSQTVPRDIGERTASIGSALARRNG